MAIGCAMGMGDAMGDGWFGLTYVRYITYAEGLDCRLPAARGSFILVSRC